VEKLLEANTRYACSIASLTRTSLEGRDHVWLGEKNPGEYPSCDVFQVVQVCAGDASGDGCVGGHGGLETESSSLKVGFDHHVAGALDWGA